MEWDILQRKALPSKIKRFNPSLSSIGLAKVIGWNVPVLKLNLFYHVMFFIFLKRCWLYIARS